MTITSAALLLFFIIDPIGNIPAFMAVLQPVPAELRQRIVVRELFIALLALVIFLFLGQHLLSLLQVSSNSLGIAGGIILFLISIKMIFSGSEGIFAGNSDSEPFIVPLAVPLLAGPSAMAMLMLMMAREPERWLDWLLAVIIAWLAAGIILLAAEPVARKLGRRFMLAVQRLIGLILTTVAVEMLLNGVLAVLKSV